MPDYDKIFADMGCPPVTPPRLRSSDHDLCLTDPFRYFLVRRLGLVPALSPPDARDEGTWLHTHLSLIDKPPIARDVSLNQQRSAAHAEIERAADEFDVPDSIRNERKADVDSLCASTQAWWEAALDAVPIGKYPTLRSYLQRPNWQPVLIEHTQSIPGLPIPSVIQIDRMIYDETNNCVDIFDLKSCAETTRIRAATCSFEFQTRHYLFGERAILGSLGLPKGCYIRDMCHILWQKPTIRISNDDRPYHWYSEGKKSGVTGTAKPKGGHWEVTCSGWPNPEVLLQEQHAIDRLHEATGKKPEKSFLGDPDPARYLERCKRWYAGTGEFSAEGVQRGIDESPVLDVSRTSATLLLDLEVERDYRADVDTIVHYATCPPDPALFPRNYPKLREFRRLSPYYHFYVQPVDEWPRIIADEKFVVAHR
jgi:hypothetical protein